MEMTYGFEVIGNDNGVFTVVKFYRNKNLGKCHVGYIKIAARSEDTAVLIARQAMA